MKTDILIVADKNCKRLDSFLSEQLNQTRNHCVRLLEQGCVLLNGKPAEKSQSVKVSDQIAVSFLETKSLLDVEPQNIPLDIVFEDSDVIVLNKPQNLTVHPSSTSSNNTLVNALLFHVKDLSGINGVLRPGIVHRLDKDTSGLLVVAKNDKSHVELQRQIQKKICKRIYVALVEGVLKTDSGVVDKPVGRDKKDRKKMAIDASGRVAKTHFNVLQRYKGNTLVEFELSTGRTHQIRVHAKFLGHPVVGDKTYGFKNQRFNLDGQLLHAKKLAFFHPSTGEFLEFDSQLPQHFTKILNILEKEKTE